MTTGKAVMGLNDTAVGIPPGPWLGELLTRIVGPRHAEFALTSSYMYSAEKALQVWYLLCLEMFGYRYC